MNLTVSDPFGEQAQASIPVQVVAVDDPPTAFSLIGPPNETLLTEWSWVTQFSWHRSFNVDVGDSVTYNFYLSPDPSLTGPGTVAVTFLADTTLLLNMRVNGTYYWGGLGRRPAEAAHALRRGVPHRFGLGRAGGRG